MIGCIGVPDADPAVRALLNRARPDSLVRGNGWTVAVVGDGPTHPADDAVLAVAGQGRPCGMAVGRVFDGTGSRRRTRPLPVDWLLSDRALTGRVWGRYVALAGTVDGRLHVARDPLGLSPCYVAEHGGGRLVSTSMAALVGLLVDRPALDWEFLGSFIRQGLCPTTRTAFRGVRQVEAGTVVSTDGRSLTSRTVWNAADLAAWSRPPDPEQVRQVLSECTQAWCADAATVVVDLSGGLDSSAVCWAATTGTAPVQARFFRFPVGPSVDEYGQAAGVAELLGVPLHPVDAGDILPVTAATRPHRLTDAPQLQSVEARLNEVLGDMTAPGATVISGGAGDQVFMSTVGDDAAADLVLEYGRRHGPFGALAQAWHARSATRPVAGTALRAAAVAWQRRGGRGRGHASLAFPPPRWLSPGARPLAPALPPRTERLSNLKAQQVLGVAYWAGSVDREHRNPHRPMVYPMLSQPLVELALRAPVADLVNHRGDRIPLRQALTGVLPRSVTVPGPKASYAGVYHRGLHRAAGEVADLLVDGVVAGQGLLDRDLLLADIHATATGARPRPNWPLFSVLAVEAWCRAWAPQGAVTQRKEGNSW